LRIRFRAGLLRVAQRGMPNFLKDVSEQVSRNRDLSHLERKTELAEQAL
jgi:hypothetical protein